LVFCFHLIALEQKLPLSAGEFSTGQMDSLWDGLLHPDVTELAALWVAHGWLACTNNFYTAQSLSLKDFHGCNPIVLKDQILYPRIFANWHEWFNDLRKFADAF
jgi:hypothetical protein